MFNNLTGYKVILGSASPRRRDLLTMMGISFEIFSSSIEENLDPGLEPHQAACKLAKRKALGLMSRFDNDDVLLITADTIVVLDKEILGKPPTRNEAKTMLRKLGNTKHDVITGVCLMSNKRTVDFYDVTAVTFGQLTEEEIDYYVNNYDTLDKAGAYGIQDWIGLTRITHIEGSFYNVMGLPVHRIYEYLSRW